MRKSLLGLSLALSLLFAWPAFSGETFKLGFTSEIGSNYWEGAQKFKELVD